MIQAQPTPALSTDAGPVSTTPAFRAAWWRLHAWSFGLYLAACVVAYFWFPLEAIIMAGLGVVFGAMTMAISMVAARWRALCPHADMGLGWHCPPLGSLAGVGAELSGVARRGRRRRRCLVGRADSVDLRARPLRCLGRPRHRDPRRCGPGNHTQAKARRGPAMILQPTAYGRPASVHPAGALVHGPPEHHDSS